LFVWAVLIVLTPEPIWAVLELWAVPESSWAVLELSWAVLVVLVLIVLRSCCSWASLWAVLRDLGSL
jgi:hypothetical protein